MPATDEDNRLDAKRLALIFKYWMVKFLSDSFSPPSPLILSSCPTHLASGVTSISTAAAVCRPLLPPLVLLRASPVSTLSRAFLSVPSASPSDRLPAEEGLGGWSNKRDLHSTPQELPTYKALTRAPPLQSAHKSPLYRALTRAPLYRALTRAPPSTEHSQEPPLQSTHKSPLYRALTRAPSTEHSQEPPTHHSTRVPYTPLYKSPTHHSTRVPYTPFYKSPSYRALTRAPYTPLYKSPLHTTLQEPLHNNQQEPLLKSTIDDSSTPCCKSPPQLHHLVEEVELGTGPDLISSCLTIQQAMGHLTCTYVRTDTRMNRHYNMSTYKTCT